MAESPVVERGVLTAPGPAWDAAVRQAEVIGRLAGMATVGLAAADEAAAELGVVLSARTDRGCSRILTALADQLHDQCR